MVLEIKFFLISEVWKLDHETNLGNLLKHGIFRVEKACREDLQSAQVVYNLIKKYNYLQTVLFILYILKV